MGGPARFNSRGFENVQGWYYLPYSDTPLSDNFQPLSETLKMMKWNLSQRMGHLLWVILPSMFVVDQVLIVRLWLSNDADEKSIMTIKDQQMAIVGSRTLVSPVTVITWLSGRQMKG